MYYGVIDVIVGCVSLRPHSVRNFTVTYIPQTFRLLWISVRVRICPHSTEGFLRERWGPRRMTSHTHTHTHRERERERDRAGVSSGKEDLTEKTHLRYQMP